MQGRSTTLLDILNIALGMLGVDPVTDYDTTNSTAADKAKRFMLLSIDKMQRDYLWKELLTTRVVNKVTGNDYAYAIPDDCLRPMGAKVDFGQPTTWLGAQQQMQYDVEGQELKVTFDTTEPVKLFFVRREDDPTKWSSELEECVALCIAMRSCFLVTDNQMLLDQLRGDLLQLTLPKARELQSKYARNYNRHLPSGFSNLRTRIG